MSRSLSIDKAVLIRSSARPARAHVAVGQRAIYAAAPVRPRPSLLPRDAAPVPLSRGGRPRRSDQRPPRGPRQPAACKRHQEAIIEALAGELASRYSPNCGPVTRPAIPNRAAGGGSGAAGGGGRRSRGRLRRASIVAAAPEMTPARRRRRRRAADDGIDAG